MDGTIIKRHPLVGYRESQGLSQAELAAVLGVEPATISRWETGLRRPAPRYLPKLAELTGASVGELIGVEIGAPEHHG